MFDCMGCETPYECHIAKSLLDFDTTASQVARDGGMDQGDRAALYRRAAIVAFGNYLQTRALLDRVYGTTTSSALVCKDSYSWRVEASSQADHSSDESE